MQTLFVQEPKKIVSNAVLLENRDSLLTLKQPLEKSQDGSKDGGLELSREFSREGSQEGSCLSSNERSQITFEGSQGEVQSYEKQNQGQDQSNQEK